MYDFGHPRTAKQYEVAWGELKIALGSDNEAGLLLGVSGEQLLLDGTPLESAAAEKAFARMLSGAGIASIHFSPNVTQASLTRLVKGFPTGTSSKPLQLAGQLKSALQGDPSIHVNEVCFVPADSAVAKSTVAAQLMSRTIGMSSEQQDALFNSPEKLLQLIVAAEGTKAGQGAPSDGESNGSPAEGARVQKNPDAPGRWGIATSGIRASRSARGGAGSMTVETGLMTLHEDELQGILQVLAQVARTSEVSKGRLDPEAFQSRLSTLPRRARFSVSQALSALAAQAPSESPDKPTLLKLAEHIAVRFAVESFERGDAKASAVRQMLEEMSTELVDLRKVLGVYEEEMTRAGVAVPSHADLLAQQFWARVPEEKQRAALESEDAWCLPPAKARECLEKLAARGENAVVDRILRNYATGINKESKDVRRQAAMGLAELAPLYASADEKLFVDTIRHTGVQLAEETDSELQSLVGAAFVRLAQEATSKRAFRAIQRSVEVVDYVEAARPGVGKNLRPRISIETRLPEFVDEAVRARKVPSGLMDLLRRMPGPAADNIAGRFSRVGFREDCDLLVSMMQVLGAEGLEHLNARLLRGNPHDATETVGILARLDMKTLEKVLPDRMKEWKRTAHDRVVRQLSASGAEGRGRLLLTLFDDLDALIRPLAVDEIGISGEQSATTLLLRIAEGNAPKGGTEYLRLKAMEALGRLRSPHASALLRKVAESRKTWRWAYPSELRLVAAQALQKIDPDWANNFLAASDLSASEFSIEVLDTDPASSALRQRRYPRLRLDQPMWANTTNLRENFRVEIAEITLGGGVAICEQSLHPGSVVDLKLNAAQKGIRALTIVRDANTQARAFEVVDIDMEERAKLRKVLVQLRSALKESTPNERSRGHRTIFSNLT